MKIPQEKIDHFKEIIKSEFKKSNVKSFIFFLIFSSIIWLIVQFSQPYTEVLKIPITYENYPQDKMIDDKGTHLEIRVQQSGFQLAWYKLFDPKLDIDLSKLPAEEDHLKYNLLENHYEIAKSLPFDMNKAEFLEKEIHIPFQLKSTKKVPVVSQIRIKYAAGYDSEDSLAIIPDSMNISGPSSVIDTVTRVYTQALTLKEVKNSLSKKIPLKGIMEEVSFAQENVQYKLAVEKFTEKELEIPIEIINAPSQADISLYPGTVKVNFKVSLKKYNQVNDRDFKIKVDYKEIAEDKNFLIPKIAEKPEVVHAVRMSPKKIQYIIRK